MRIADIERETNETQIRAKLNLDSKKFHQVSTGIGFFDHMLTAFAVHGNFGLELDANGDLEIDCHHTVEDTGIVLGTAFLAALGDKTGIARYGSFYIPMDEALAFCSVDISGRPFLVFDSPLKNELIGEYDSCLTEEFFRAFAHNSSITMHIKVVYGSNPHHITEAIFKAAAHALKAACLINADEVLSTKGTLC